MTSKTSCFNAAVLKKNITRFCPVWILYSVGLMIAYPLTLSSNYLSEYSDPTEFLINLTSYGGTVFNFVFAAILAACCFKYLYQTRSAYMVHAFPVTRGCLFRTNLLSGILMGIVPFLAALLLSAFLMLQSGTWAYLAIPVFVYCICLFFLQFLFFYGLAVFCMHLVGQLVSGILIYGTLNFLAIGMEILIRSVIEPLMYGYLTSGFFTVKFSPVVQIFSHPPQYDIDALCSYRVDWFYFGIIAAVGVVFLVAAWLLYRKRHMEACGEFIAFRFARPIFQYLFTLTVTLLLGLVLSLIIYGDFDLLKSNAVGSLLCMIFAAFIGFFIAEMLLKRTVRVFKAKAFRKYGVFILVLSATLAAFRLDWFGIVRYVPDASDVSSVTINTYDSNYGLNLSDPEDIKAVTEIHSLMTQTRTTTNIDSYVIISYSMKSGKHVSRQYPLAYEDAFTTAAERESRQLLDALMSDPQKALQYYHDLRLETCHYAEIELAYEDGTDGLSFDSQLLSSSEIAQLVEALYADAADGNLPACRSQYYYAYNGDRDWHVSFGYYDRSNVILNIPDTAKNTIAFLESVLDSTQEP